jgi:hypothetical protein
MKYFLWLTVALAGLACAAMFPGPGWSRCDVEALFYSWELNGIGNPSAGCRATLCSDAYIGKWEFEYKFEDGDGPMHEGTYKKSDTFGVPPSQEHHVVTITDAPSGWTKCYASYWVGCYKTAEDYQAGTFEDDDKDPTTGWKLLENE